MFELAILYIIFNMATSNINKISKYNRKKMYVVATELKKKSYSVKQSYPQCCVTATFLKKLTLLYHSVIITKMPPLTKPNFNGKL